MINIHPARKYSYETLVTELDARVMKGYISRVFGQDGLVLYNYTNSCTYDRAWDEFTMMARGLIIDHKNHCIAATPFSKFFNYGENGTVAPDLPFQAYEKLDGSMIIVFYHNGSWKTATRGSFNSEQAKWAQNIVNQWADDHLYKPDTYIFEAVYKANKIVVNYDYEGLVLLGAYTEHGDEYQDYELHDVANSIGIKRAKLYNFDSFSDLLSQAPLLTRNEEGFVVRFSNGLRLKIKGDEYKRIHRMVSNLSPLSVWEAMLNKSDLVSIRRELPEEFWVDFDKIVGLLDSKRMDIMTFISLCETNTKHMTNKEIGLDNKIPSDIKGYLFNIRNGNEMRNHEKIMNSIRPTGNVLEGYSLSSGLREVQNDN